jgi:hypothetical protein
MTVTQIYFGSFGYIGESISLLFAGAARYLPKLGSIPIFFVVFIFGLISILVISGYGLHLPFGSGIFRLTSSATPMFVDNNQQEELPQPVKDVGQPQHTNQQLPSHVEQRQKE